MHEIFLDNIDSQDEFVAISSLKGLCNLAPNPIIVEFLGKKESLDKIVTCIIERKKLIDFLINGLLLIATICQLDNPFSGAFCKIKLLDKNKECFSEEQKKIYNLIQNIFDETDDIRIKNYCQIILQIQFCN